MPSELACLQYLHPQLAHKTTCLRFQGELRWCSPCMPALPLFTLITLHATAFKTVYLSLGIPCVHKSMIGAIASTFSHGSIYPSFLAKIYLLANPESRHPCSCAWNSSRKAYGVHSNRGPYYRGSIRGDYLRYPLLRVRKYQPSSYILVAFLLHQLLHL